MKQTGHVYAQNLQFSNTIQQ